MGFFSFCFCFVFVFVVFFLLQLRGYYVGIVSSFMLDIVAIKKLKIVHPVHIDSQGSLLYICDWNQEYPGVDLNCAVKKEDFCSSSNSGSKKSTWFFRTFRQLRPCRIFGSKIYGVKHIPEKSLKIMLKIKPSVHE